MPRGWSTVSPPAAGRHLVDGNPLRMAQPPFHRRPASRTATLLGTRHARRVHRLAGPVSVSAEPYASEAKPCAQASAVTLLSAGARAPQGCLRVLPTLGLTAHAAGWLRGRCQVRW